VIDKRGVATAVLVCKSHYWSRQEAVLTSCSSSSSAQTCDLVELGSFGSQCGERGPDTKPESAQSPVSSRNWETHKVLARRKLRPALLVHGHFCVLRLYWWQPSMGVGKIAFLDIEDEFVVRLFRGGEGNCGGRLQGLLECGWRRHLVVGGLRSSASFLFVGKVSATGVREGVLVRGRESGDRRVAHRVYGSGHPRAIFWWWGFEIPQKSWTHITIDRLSIGWARTHAKCPTVSVLPCNRR
jgi:hypothetical protein